VLLTRPKRRAPDHPGQLPWHAFARVYLNIVAHK
jgi:hypothetical protein